MKPKIFTDAQDVLQALSTLCQHHEDNRRQVLKEKRTLKLILSALEFPEAPVSGLHVIAGQNPTSISQACLRILHWHPGSSARGFL